MKWSRYNKRDVGKMLFRIILIILCLAVIAIIGIKSGAKYVAPKLETFIDKIESKIEEAKIEKSQENLQNNSDESFVQEENILDEEDILNEEIQITDIDESIEETEIIDTDESMEETEIIDTDESIEETEIHRYEYITVDCSWLEAMEYCKAMDGYLVNINSQEELEYITSEIESLDIQNMIFYLGASRGAGEDFYWINSDNEPYGNSLNNDDNEWAFGQWLQGEPSYYDGDIEEIGLSMFYYEDEQRWVFNDIPNNMLDYYSYYSGRIGYICEFDE